MKRLRAIFLGNVQGVGFRYTAQDEAVKFDVKGWVKNRSDGGVEMVAEGAKDILQQFLVSLTSAMSYHIRDTEVSWEPATEEFSRFEIRY
jgi:acylphosphatase